MKKKIIAMVLVWLFFIISFNFALAGDPLDPGNPDTVWLYRVPMNMTWIGSPFFIPKPFAVQCSVWVDDTVWGWAVPISFYHSENLDILCDSVVWGNSVTPPQVDGRSIENDSTPPAVDKPPKVFSCGGVSFTGDVGLIPMGSKQHFFTAYFNGDYTKVPNWDTTKSIILDTITSGIMSLNLTLKDATVFIPIFHHAVIGDTAVLSGIAYQSNGTTPAPDSTIYCRGKDVTANPDTFLGRVFRTKTNVSGNFKFVVGKGGYWCVFRDTTGGLNPESPGNAHCFDPLVSDHTDLRFKGYVDVEEEEAVVIPENFTLFQNYPNPFNPTTVIKFYLPEDSWVKVEVFNLLGQKVKTLADKAMPSGIREVVWNGKNENGKSVASGIYFYKVKTDKFEDVKKMILLK